MVVGTLMDAARNHGQVLLTYDSQAGRHVATKRIPNAWICACPEEFAQQHPQETERPWADVLAVASLTGAAFPYVCGLVGVYRDEESTYIVTELASEGDLFTFCNSPSGVCEPPGLAREARLLPIIAQIFDCVRSLHGAGVAHGDLSLENLLLTKCGSEGALALRVIDFGMSTTARLRDGLVGKAAYQAPEMHSGAEYDPFQADAFSLGVVLFALLMRDYPWAATDPAAGCRCFAGFQRLGFRRFAAKRSPRGACGRVAQHLSEPMARLLEGLLAIDPRERLSILEPGSGRASVWQEPLLQYALRFLPTRSPAAQAEMAGCGRSELHATALPRVCRA